MASPDRPKAVIYGPAKGRTAARDYALRIGFDIGGEVATKRSADEALDAGEAIASITCRNDRVTMVLVDGAARRLTMDPASHPVELGTASERTIAPEMLWRAALREQTRDRQADRRERGERLGPRPIKSWRDMTPSIVQLRDEGRSLQDVAAALNQRDVPTPGGGTWHAASVKRALDFGPAEAEVILRRAGGLLAELQGAGDVQEDNLAAMGQRHLFHWRRLMRPAPGAPHNEFMPLVTPRAREFVVAPGGHGLVELYHLLSAEGPAVLGVLAEVGRDGSSVRVRELTSACERAGIGWHQLKRAWLVFDPETDAFRLTEEGRRVAALWKKVVSLDPRQRFDLSLWPVTPPAQATWDWEDEPSW